LKIAITGASGFIGRHLVTSLAKTGHSIRAVLHRKSPDHKADKNTEYIVADVHDPESLNRAFENIDIVYHLVGIIAETRRLTFDKTVIAGTQNVIAACLKNHVQHIIYLSALGTSENAASKYHKSKWRAEETIRNAGIDYTILRPSIIFGPHDGFVNMLTGMIKWLPLTPVVGSGEFLLQPIYIDDFIGILIDTLRNNKSRNKTVEIGGPEKLTYKEILTILKRVLNKKRGNLYLPMWFMRLNAFLLERIMKPSPITTDQLNMLEAGNTCDNKMLPEIFEIELTPFEEGLRKYMR
jgi:uncharacterized protein YbjT (DUF2867 family)